MKYRIEGILLLALLAGSVHADDITSTWNGGDGSWSTASQWTPGVSPNNGGGNTYEVTIGSTGRFGLMLDTSATVNSLTLGNARLYSYTGQSLTVNGPALIQNSWQPGSS